MIERLRARTDGFTVTPEQYVRVAYFALGALTLIVLSGAAVRLSGSGLGCPDWPKCYGKAYPPLNTHALIEFSNRVITAPVSIAAGAAWVCALRRRPYRRDLVWLSALLPLGVVGQAVLGGFTVRGALDYGWVMGHFALSMLILLAAAALAWRAGHEPAERPARVAGSTDPVVVRALRGLTALGALTIFAGTAATAAGPHAGGSPGQKINRLSFDGRGTMDFVIHRHGEIALAFGLGAVAVWWLARRRPAAPVVRQALTALCMLLVLQGAVGLDQYKTHLPTELVWVHVGLACAAWLAVLWATLAAGRLAPRGMLETGELQAREAPLRPVAQVKLPGN
jgi:cytochrome c oxidase assembly protein subunit 15